MNRSLIRILIMKDLYVYRWMMVAALVAGTVSLGLTGVSDGDGVNTGPDIGMILFITTIITFGILITMVGILKERQDRSQLFILSLPVSIRQYAFAKLSAALIAFVTPCVALTLVVVVYTVASGQPTEGLPVFVAMMMLFFANFCLLMAVIVVTMSEAWAVVGILIGNLAVTISLSRMGRLAAGESAAWGPTLVTVLVIETAIVGLSLALAFYVSSHRKDLI